MIVAFAGLGLLIAGSTAPNANAAAPVPAGDAFYVAPHPLRTAKPGTIIRSTPIADAPAGARAWRVLYHSRAVDGGDIAVSGVVVAPTGKAPRGGRVVVTWAHGGTGLADLCAPSKQDDIASGASGAGIGFPRALIPMLQTFLDAGYVVAATDYEGLGTPGRHPLLVGESGGRGVLDAARAARNLKTAASSKALVFGLSSGGNAALFAGELAASYAPELRVLGVTAVAPVPAAEQTLPFTWDVSAFNAAAVSVVEAYHAAYAEFDPAVLLTPDALAKASVVDQKCDITDTFSNSADPALTQNPLDTPALAAILHTNSPGNHPAGAPLLVVQGTADQLVPQLFTDAFVTKACGTGDTVDYRLYEGANHGDPEMTAAANDIAAWFADRVSGAPATSTCSP
jgi:hypothetical protein